MTKGRRKSFWNVELASSSCSRNFIASCRRESTEYMAIDRFGCWLTSTKKSDRMAQIFVHTIRIRIMLTCAVSTILVRLYTRGDGAPSSARTHRSAARAESPMRAAATGALGSPAALTTSGVTIVIGEPEPTSAGITHGRLLLGPLSLARELSWRARRR